MIREGKVAGWLQLPVNTLQSWAVLNNATFDGVTFGPLAGFEEHGSTVIAKRKLTGSDTTSPLMIVPRDLVLSKERVHEHAKYDRDFREVLDALGDFGRTSRGAILSFLLMQCSVACPTMPEKRGVTSALSEYVKFLPLELLPTFWTESERDLLKGTSLAPALEAKLKALYREYDAFRTATEKIPWCTTCWWDEVDGLLSFDDWLQVDAMYRSRALEFPGIGDCMAPCIDMANHESGDLTKAIYEVDPDGNALFLLRDGQTVEEGGQISITYGDKKGACELLFSYGFLEHGMENAKEMFLDLSIPDDDPLKRAKNAVSKTPPGVKLVQRSTKVEWESDYIWLICVNEEDGLDFAVQETTAGKRELKAFWKSQEMASVDNLEDLLRKDEHWPIFQLRACSIVRERVEASLELMIEAHTEQEGLADVTDNDIRERPRQLVAQLRELEGELLEAARQACEATMSQLLEDDVVQKYLSAPENSTADEEEDFS